MASLTGNTAGSLKKMWPPIKKKAIDAHPSFATFLGNSGTNIASGESKVTAPKAKGGGRKRKADAEVNGENETKSAEAKSATLEKSDSAGGKSTSKKAAPAKKPAKRAKKEVKQEVKSEEDSADGGDGLGEFRFRDSVLSWLHRADGCSDAAEENAEV